MTEVIRIVVQPRGGSPTAAFSAHLGGRCLCLSPAPFLAAARVLLTEGHQPSEILEMWHPGATEFALRSTIGEAAATTVREGKGAPTFAFFEPYAGPRT